MHAVGPATQARWTIRLALPVVLALASTLAIACSPGQPLLYGVETSRSFILPGDEVASATELRYYLAAPGLVTLSAESANGERFLLRRDEPRPVAGSYVFRFDGTYDLPDDPVQRRVLADGRYRLVVEARDEAGRSDQASVEVHVNGADVEPPGIHAVRVSPSVITPNFDGQDDLAYLSYRLDKLARVWHYVLDDDGQRRWSGLSEERVPGEYTESWNGLEHGRPVPDGTYQLVVRAEDQAGNVSKARVAVQVAGAGLPLAQVLDVTFSPRSLVLGDLLRVEIRVRNVGELLLRTHGPDPGYTYSSYDNYFSIEDRQAVDRAGYWRVGVDWAGAPGPIGGKYPYRWGFGEDLQPGQETTVVGYIRIEHEDQRAHFERRADFHRMHFFAALVQEGVAIHHDRVGLTEINVSF